MHNTRIVVPLNKILLFCLLWFFCFLPFQGRTADEFEAPEPDNLEKKVAYIVLHSADHEVYDKDNHTWKLGDQANHKIEEDHKATLTIKRLKPPNSVQFIFEHTGFSVNSQPVQFPETSPYLDKLKSLSPDGESKNYNHLCMALFVTYVDNTNISKVVESPLYAKWVGGTALSNEGDLKKDLKAEFYTRANSPAGCKLAYFTCEKSSYNVKVCKDESVFSVEGASCYNSQFTPVCKQFFRVDSEDADKINCTILHSNNKEARTLCGHTEPNALFHVLKRAESLFKPLIDEAGGIDMVKSVGIRCFSYYEACIPCLSVLNSTKNINLEGKGCVFNNIFYFQRKYDPNPHVIRVYQNPIIKRFTNLEHNGIMSIGVLQEDNVKIKDDGTEYDVLGCIKVAESINLDDNKKVLLVPPINDNIDETEKYKIYVTTFH